MSISRNLFGDFPVVFRTSLPVPIAVGRLAATSDLSTFHDERPQLRGYATANEVVLWEGRDLLINPFRPYFHGSFSQEQGTTVLSGIVRADWRVKLWCTVAVAGGCAALFGSSDDWARALGVLAVAVVAFVLLHHSIRPTSGLARSLTTKIEAAVVGEGVLNSFKSEPLRDSDDHRKDHGS